MAISTKCGYCKVLGHQISRCTSEMGMHVYNNIKSRAIDYLTTNTQSTIHFRALLFYDHLENSYSLKELRFVTAKLMIGAYGTKPMLAARIIHDYFFKDILLRQNQVILSFNDRVNLDEYMKFWKDIEIGVEYHIAEAELNAYFDFLDSLEIIDDYIADDNTDTFISKFQILVSMKMNELNNTKEKVETFECVICMEDECDESDKVDIDCNHSFCKDCVVRVMNVSQYNHKHPCCALCRKEYSTIYVRNKDIMEIINSNYCIN